MRNICRVTGAMLLACWLVPGVAVAQDQRDLWRAFVEKVEVGTELTVRLRDGQRFRATLIGTRDDAVMLQPKTRVPVPVQPVPYDAIVSLERRGEGGMGAAKAAAIGVASGAATFLGILLILLATVD